MTDKIKVSYRYTARATLMGEMEVPLSLWGKDDPKETWTDDVEQYISENHDLTSQPPEIDDDFDHVFDVEPAP